MYRYYSIQRPVSLGTYPKVKDNKPVAIENFDTRVYVKEIKREAWGYLEYQKPLTDRQIANYELKEVTSMESKIKISQEVLDGILEVRNSGKVNMFDVNAVQYLANKNGAYETVTWIEDHKKEYGQIIFGNFEIEHL